MSLEQLFNSSTLQLLIPDASIEFPIPSRYSADEWLSQVETKGRDRNQAFFDEQLHCLLTVRLGSLENNDGKPPPELVKFLIHLQIAIEATYISPVPTSLNAPRTSLLAAPPRTVSSKEKPRQSSLHPSIFPPNTPNPIPTATANDQRYIQSEGTLLWTKIWAHDSSDDSREAFQLIWSDKESVWVAIYRLAFSVSFLKLNYANPLLCLTVSTTLRERPIAAAQKNNPLVVFLSAEDVMPQERSVSLPEPPNELPEDDFADFEDINLLEGLLAGPTFSPSGPERIFLPSSRLSTSFRQQIFPLSSIIGKSENANDPNQSRQSKTPSPHPILRKSFRKTMQTVSGFKVRMRTVLVPFVGSNANDDQDTGGEERTVVLCVEVENTGESGCDVGFELEGADISVGGEGASAKLIGVGEEDAAKTFPLLIKSMEQYNLLYAVSFLRSPQDTDLLSSSSPDKSDLKRMVVINVHLKPFVQPGQVSELAYPTNTFSSRWSCVLDLAASETYDAIDMDGSNENSVLPEPASPFPMPNTPVTSTAGQEKAPIPQLAGNRRHTLPVNLFANRWSQSPNSKNLRTSLLTPNLSSNNPHRSNPPSRLSFTPPSIRTQSPRTPTTYEPPSAFDIPAGFDSPPSTGALELPDGSQKQGDTQPPPTPAYPAYPPGTPGFAPSLSQAPIGAGSGNLAPSLEIRRDRGRTDLQTPAPTMAGGGIFAQQMAKGRDRGANGDPIVVSVGLVKPKGASNVTLYPLDQFLLDIFVFNKSSWTRRFEVSVPDTRRMRRLEGKGGAEYFARGGTKAIGAGPGIIPLENRIRIGPLRPSTCQSVEMEFLALSPGIHTIDMLTLTDVESGFSVNLRSVADIVVHERNE